jgi:hypothetical protein
VRREEAIWDFVLLYERPRGGILEVKNISERGICDFVIAAPQGASLR